MAGFVDDFHPKPPGNPPVIASSRSNRIARTGFTATPFVPTSVPVQSVAVAGVAPRGMFPQRICTSTCFGIPHVGCGTVSSCPAWASSSVAFGSSASGFAFASASSSSLPEVGVGESLSGTFPDSRLLCEYVTSVALDADVPLMSSGCAHPYIARGSTSAAIRLYVTVLFIVFSFSLVLPLTIHPNVKHALCQRDFAES
jgi:hypothetical protein